MSKFRLLTVVLGLGLSQPAVSATLTVGDGTLTGATQFDYTSAGFTWSNPSEYYFDCTKGMSDRTAVTMFTLDAAYDHEGCLNNVSFTQTDTGTFSVSSVKVSAVDNTLKTPAVAVVPDGTVIRTYYAEYDFRAEFAQAGVDPYSPEGQILFRQLEAEAYDLKTAYDQWIASSQPFLTDRFYFVGYRNGQEVARQTYSQTAGIVDLALVGFSGIDRLMAGYVTGNLMYNHYVRDYFSYDMLGADETFCYYACERVNIYGFDYTLDTVAPVPLPAGLPLMLGSVALLAGFARKRVAL